MIRLVKDYDIAFVSTGDVLRKEIMAKSDVGKRAEEVVASGGRHTPRSPIWQEC
jgi:adenylate kinase family enzyme